MRVPFVDLKIQYDSVKTEMLEAIGSVLESTQFVGGAPLEAFEQEFATYCETQFALGVGNGTDALELALEAFGIGPGDEVITQANSFMATASAIVRRGAKPIFVDIDPETYTIDPASIEAVITERTKAIIPVHLYGHPADMDPINEIARRHDLIVLEDAAQAHGATYKGRRVGSLGHAACFSFYPGKNLGAYGDGGAVTSNDANFIARVRQLREHGRGATKYEHAVVGMNSRLDTVQAAVLSIKLRHLDRWNKQRQEAAKLYAEQLDGCGLKVPSIRSGSSHVFHLFVIEINDRDAVIGELDSAGVSTGIHYPVPLHLQPALLHIEQPAQSLQRAEESAKRLLSLPMFPEIAPQQVEQVTDALRRLSQSGINIAAQ